MNDKYVVHPPKVPTPAGKGGKRASVLVKQKKLLQFRK
jgi:hypothetical protein